MTIPRINPLFGAMLLGFLIGYLRICGIWPWTAPSWLLPALLFLMLFFTFCKINPVDLRIHRWHVLLLAFQLVFSVLLFLCLRPIDLTTAQGIMLCVLMPSATAAPIIAGKLGGSIQTLTTYTLLSNGSTAFIVPLLFPWVNPDVQMPFLVRFWQIMQHVAPLLLTPFFAAWALRLLVNAYYRHTRQQRRFVLAGTWAQLPFWTWTLSLVVLMSQLMVTLANFDGSVFTLVALFMGALITCLIQFLVGKNIGQHWPSVAHGEDYQDVVVAPSLLTDDPCQLTRISAGQALGQKNTTLAIWMAASYLHPVSAIAPAAYIIWQNLFNSWQLSRAVHGKKV